MKHSNDEFLVAHEQNIGKWATALNNFQRSFRTKLSNEEKTEITFDAVAVFADMLRLFAKKGNFKDTWKPCVFMDIPFGLQVTMESEKTGIQIDMGIEAEGIFLQTDIHHAENLKNMGDDFWKLFLEASEFGEFAFCENAGMGKEYRKKHPQLFRTFKGNVFRLMRNYLAVEIEFGDGVINDLGWLEVRWRDETNLDTILLKGCDAFRCLYKLNYALWKVSDLRK